MFLLKRSLGSIFPTCIVAYQFVITKGGWIFLHNFFDQYMMVVSDPHFCVSEGFFN